MIMDKRIEFADAIALNTGVAGSYLVGDVLDLGLARDVGLGEYFWLVINVQTTATSGGAATLVVNLVTDSAAALSSPVILVSSASFAVAALIAGVNVLAIRLPAEGVAYKRYIGIQQVTGTAAFTAGKIDAFMVQDYAKWRAYADAIN